MKIIMWDDIIMDKYQVIRVSCDNFNVVILETFDCFDSACAYLQKYVDEQYELDKNWLKCYHDSESCVSIYRYFWLSPKVLVDKIHIIKFKIAVQ
jgi:hypothetical protein